MKWWDFKKSCVLPICSENIYTGPWRYAGGGLQSTACSNQTVAPFLILETRQRISVYLDNLGPKQLLCRLDSIQGEAMAQEHSSFFPDHWDTDISALQGPLEGTGSSFQAAVQSPDWIV